MSLVCMQTKMDRCLDLPSGSGANSTGKSTILGNVYLSKKCQGFRLFPLPFVNSLPWYTNLRVLILLWSFPPAICLLVLPPPNPRSPGLRWCWFIKWQWIDPCKLGGAAHGAFNEDGNKKQMKLLKMCKKLKIPFLSLSLSHGSLLRGLFFWGGGDAEASFQGPAQAICIGQPWKKGGYMAHGIALTVSSHQTSGPCLSPGRIRDR